MIPKTRQNSRQSRNVRKTEEIAFYNGKNIITYLHIDIDIVQCNLTENVTLDSKECPEKSQCIENGTNKGLCMCNQDFQINPEYSATNKSIYCIQRTGNDTAQKTSSTLAPQTTTTTKAKEVTQLPTQKTIAETTTVKIILSSSTAKPESPPPTSSDRHETKVIPANPTPEVHHFLGGILIPLFIVFGFVGAVFVIRKYDVLDRAHSWIRNRNSNTRYDGLMENDFDDDPLLI